MQKITTNLWFDKNAEEAANFYVSLFKNSKITEITHFTTVTPSNPTTGGVMTVTFELDGTEYTALNGGTYFKLTEAVSLIIHCDDQAEIDHYWEKLSADPESEQCGWVKDKFGLSWQIVPSLLLKLIADPDTEKSKRVMEAMMKMKKIIVADLEKAAA